MLRLLSQHNVNSNILIKLNKVLNLSTALTTVHLSLEPADKDRLAVLCGSFDDNIKQIERRLGVEVIYKDAQFQIVGEHSYAQACGELINDL